MENKRLKKKADDVAVVEEPKRERGRPSLPPDQKLFNISGSVNADLKKTYEYLSEASGEPVAQIVGAALKYAEKEMTKRYGKHSTR